MGKEDIVAGLDIGTTKIAAVIGEIGEEGEIKIVGLGTAPAEGLKRGVVVNLEQTVNSIIKAVQDAELMAGVKVESIYAGIAGDHIRSINSRGVIAVTRTRSGDKPGRNRQSHRSGENCGNPYGQGDNPCSSPGIHCG